MIIKVSCKFRHATARLKLPISSLKFTIFDIRAFFFLFRPGVQFPTKSPRGARGTGLFADVGSESRAQGWYLGIYPLNAFLALSPKRPSPGSQNPGRVRLPRSTLQPNTQARPKDARPAVPSRLRCRTVIIAIFFHYVIFKLWKLYLIVLHRYRYYFYWATKLQSFPIVYQNHFSLINRI